MRRDFGRAESALLADQRRGKRVPEAGLPSISSPPYPRVGFSDVLINANQDRVVNHTPAKNDVNDSSDAVSEGENFLSMTRPEQVANRSWIS